MLTVRLPAVLLDEGTQVDLRQFLGTLRVRWKFMVSTIVLGVAATVLIVMNIPAQYGSGVKLFVSTPTNGQADYSSSLLLLQRVGSYADLATDQTLMQRVIGRLDLDTTPDELAGRISAEVITNTQTIQIDVTADSPEKAQQIAAAESEELVALVTRLEDPGDSSASPAVVARVA